MSKSESVGMDDVGTYHSLNAQNVRKLEKLLPTKGDG